MIDDSSKYTIWISLKIYYIETIYNIYVIKKVWDIVYERYIIIWSCKIFFFDLTLQFSNAKKYKLLEVLVLWLVIFMNRVINIKDDVINTIGKGLCCIVFI